MELTDELKHILKYTQCIETLVRNGFKTNRNDILGFKKKIDEFYTVLKNVKIGSNVTEEDLKIAIELLEKWKIDTLYNIDLLLE